MVGNLLVLKFILVQSAELGTNLACVLPAPGMNTTKADFGYFLDGSAGKTYGYEQAFPFTQNKMDFKVFAPEPFILHQRISD